MPGSSLENISRPNTRVPPFVWYSLIALGLQLWVLSRSMFDGRLSGLIPWDDCEFITRGLSNTEKFLESESIAQAIQSVARADFHAPVGDLYVMAGLVLFQLQTWGPYLLNFTVVLTGMLVIDRFLRDEQLWVRILASLLFAFIPFVFVGLDELKSDYKGGVFLFAGLLLLVDRRRGLYASAPSIMLPVSILLTLALLSKITAFYFPPLMIVILTISVATYTIGAGLLRWERGRYLPQVSDWAELKHPLALSAGTAALMVAVLITFWVHDEAHYLSYIRQALSPFWHDEFGLLERLFFFTPLWPASVSRWGILIWLAPFLLLWSGYLIYSRKDLSALADLSFLGLCAAFMYLPLLLVNTHNPSFGAFFYYSVLAGVFYTLRIVISALGPRGKLVFLGVIVLAASGAEQYISRSSVPFSERMMAADAFTLLAETIATAEAFDKPRVLFTYESVEMPYRNLENIAWINHRKWLDVRRLDDFEDETERSDSLAWAQWVLTARGGERAWTFNPRFPSSHQLDEIFQFVSSDKRYQPVKSIQIGAVQLTLFKRHIELLKPMLLP